MDTQSLKGGFADAPVQSAQAFRAAMEAMARPGKIERLEGAEPPAPLSVAAGTLLLVLADPETPIYLAASHDLPEVRDWITFHTGAPLTDPGSATFAVGQWSALMPIDAYRIGTPEYPDRSATLIAELPELKSEGAVLRGPGIKDTSALNVPTVSRLKNNALLFPLGLDFFFTADNQVAALPRTTKVEGA